MTTYRLGTRNYGTGHDMVDRIQLLEKELRRLETYFDLSDEELDSLTKDERADNVRQFSKIRAALKGTDT
jgi:hypothetical protein